MAERRLPFASLRPHAVWVNKHTGERTVILDFASRVERIPDAAGGFKDEHQLVVHHSANVPPGFNRGYGDDAVSFAEHWEPMINEYGATARVVETDAALSLGRLRESLVQALNGNQIAVADAWDILREWDRSTGARGDIPNFPEADRG